MKKILLLLIVIFSINTFGQKQFERQKSFVIVPFYPNLYFNDLSRIWYKSGESKSQDQQIQAISQKILQLIGDSLSRNYDVFDLNDVPSTYSNVDYLSELYQITGYAYHDTLPQRELSKKEKWKNKLSSMKKKDHSSMGELREQNKKRKHQFFNVNIKDKIKFRKITKDLDCHYILFINQVEVKGDFSSPYYNGNERPYEIMIHYSIFNKTGKLIVGNKTSITTTDKKAHYTYFINHEIPRAVLQIVQNIYKNLKLESFVNNKE